MAAGVLLGVAELRGRLSLAASPEVRVGRARGPRAGKGAAAARGPGRKFFQAVPFTQEVGGKNKG